jgi:hypothetical protein
MKRRVFSLSGGILMVFALAFVEISRADPEDQAEGRTITYTGYLEQAGNPATGSRNLSFRIFDTETGGEELWPLSEDGTARVSFTGGRFTVELGGEEMDSLPSAAFTEPELWLDVSVEGTRLGGRQRVGTSRYAVHSANAARASTAATAAAAQAGGPLESQIEALEGRGLECVTVSAGSSYGSRRAVACPVDYTVTGGSCYTGNGDVTAVDCAPDGNGWRCNSDNNHCYRVYASCCRIN